MGRGLWIGVEEFCRCVKGLSVGSFGDVGIVRFVITLTCSRCRAVLTVDDGFAGGVCRCSHCGTIQSVPASAAKTGSATGKTILHKKSSPGSGLDELGEIISSSGLAGSGLRQARRSSNETPEAKRRANVLILLVVAAVLLVGVVLGLMLANRGSVEPSVGGDSTSVGSVGELAGSDSSTARSSGEGLVGSRLMFGGIPLDRATALAVLVDRGDASRAFQGELRSALVVLSQRMRAGSTMHVVFWSGADGTPLVSDRPVPAGEFASLRSRLEETPTARSTDIGPALEAVLAHTPTDILILTGKGWQLDEGFTQPIVKAIGARPIRVHVMIFDGELPNEALQALSRTTGGRSVNIPPEEIGVRLGQ